MHKISCEQIVYRGDGSKLIVADLACTAENVFFGAFIHFDRGRLRGGICRSEQCINVILEVGLQMCLLGTSARPSLEEGDRGAGKVRICLDPDQQTALLARRR